MWRSQHNGNNHENQHVGLAHPLKGRNWTEKPSYAIGSPGSEPAPLNIILQACNRRGQFSACLPDGTILVRSSRQPFLDAARALLDAGYPATTWIEGWRSGATTFALRAQLGVAAGLTVDESKTCFARWKPFSSSAVASSMRSSEMGATIPPEAIETRAGAAVDEPDPPDQKQRPRTGNASAGT